MSAAGSDEAVALVQQEMSNLKALKRLSMGSQTSPLDPDLPQLQPQRSPSPPSSGRDQHITRRPSSRSLHRRPSRESDQDISHNVDGNTPLGLAKELWVPAHVHPEIAPNEWRSFVEEKLNEIQGNSKEKHMSRLSHLVTDRDEYMDASELLAKRRRSSGDQRRRSILELSEQLSSLGEFDSLLTTVEVPSSSDEPIVPNGGTSLRRTKHSTRRPRRFPARNDSTSSSPASFGERSSSNDLVTSVDQQPPNSAPSVLPPVSSAPPADSTGDVTKAEIPPTTSSATTVGQRRRPNISVYTGPVATASSVQPPSPSTASPPPGGSNLLTYRRRHRHFPQAKVSTDGERDAEHVPLKREPSSHATTSVAPSRNDEPVASSSTVLSSSLSTKEESPREPQKREFRKAEETELQSHPLPKEESEKGEAEVEEERTSSRSQNSTLDQRWRRLKDETETQSSKLLNMFRKKKDEHKRGHTRNVSRHTNLAETVGKSPEPSETISETTTSDSERADKAPTTQSKPELQLPYDIPAHQVTDRSIVMMYNRFPLHIERAIYRLSHMKLANPRRPLSQQVMLSNFMYAYLNLINHGYQQQYLRSQGIDPDPSSYPCGVPPSPPTEETMVNFHPTGYDSSSSSSDSDSDWEKGPSDQVHVQ